MNTAYLFKKTPYVGSVILLLIGFSVLLGYLIQNQELKASFSGFAAMNPLTAITFIISGVSLFLLYRGKMNTQLLHIGFVCAVLVALVGFIKLGGILIAQDVYIDSYLFAEQLNTEAQSTGYLNRIAPNTAICFLLIGTALILLYKNKKERLADILSLATLFVVFLTSIGYLYNARNLTGFSAYIPMATNTALAFAILSLGTLFSHQTRGLMSLIVSEKSGGVLIRKLIPALISIPPLLGYLGLTAERVGIVTGEFGLAFIVVSSVVFFTVLILLIGNELDGISIKLEESHRLLEKRVIERTARLAEKTQESESSRKALLIVLENLRIEEEKLVMARAKDEAMLASIGDGLIVVDKEGKLTYVNQAFEEMLGWQSQEILGKHIVEVVPRESENGDVVKFKERILTKILAGEKVIIDPIDPLYYVRKDKSRFPASSIVAPIFLDGRIIGAIESFRDITKEKDIDKAKTEFISIVSHQLRTPLSVANWYSEMLFAGDVGRLNEKQKKYLGEVYHSNQRMVSLVNTLLHISRIELGIFAVEPEPTNVIKLVQDIIDELKLQIDQKKLIVDEKYDKALLMLNVDPKLLSMVFQNLLSNAIKYTSDRGKISLDLHLVKRGESIDNQKVHGDSIVIIVSDTGYGIPKDQQDKVFTKFFRADNVMERDTEGTGLGLYIVKSILEHYGGKIWFSSPRESVLEGESSENPGSTFYVIFPLEGMNVNSPSKPFLAIKA